MKKLAIIATKGSLDWGYPPFILASTAAALGYEVQIFFTFYGLQLLNKTLDLQVTSLGNPGMPMPMPMPVPRALLLFKTSCFVSNPRKLGCRACYFYESALNQPSIRHKSAACIAPRLSRLPLAFYWLILAASVWHMQIPPSKKIYVSLL